MRCRLKRDNRSLAMNILILSEHIDVSIPYRNWLKHMSFNMVLCNLCPWTVYYKQSATGIKIQVRNFTVALFL